MAERVDHATLARWVVKYSPLTACEAYRRKSTTSSSCGWLCRYNRLIGPDRIGRNIQLAYCWAQAGGDHPSATAPIAEDGVKRIGELYRTGAELRGLDPEARLTGRCERYAPLITDMQIWLAHHRPVLRLSRRSE